MSLRICAIAVGCVFAARTASAHEHMYIASTAKNGGALVLDYDFARAFPLAELGNQPGAWIGVDPSFNSLVADDPARSLYRLKTGAKVTMELVAIDAGTSVLLANRTLDAAGDRATVGTMPYLHVHPQWTLALPLGTFGEGHVSFRIRSAAYDASPVYVGTLTAAPPPTTTTTSSTTTTGDGTTSTTYEGQTTTTTTTLPLPCTAASCDDHDPCTDDVCDGVACTHAAVTASDAVLCRLRGFQSVLDQEQPSTKPGRRMLARLYKAMTHAREATQVARDKGTPRHFKLVGARISRLTTIVDAADRGGLLTADGLIELQSLATTAYDALALWQQSNP